ncbi:MAG: hypothetical protein ACJ8DC_15275 [Gemmatimonadales bacterium]
MLALSGCAARYAQVPARLALQPYGRIALVTFSSSSEHANAALGTLATQQFAEAVLASQTGIELLELSPVDSSLRHLPAGGDGTALAQAVGRDKKVPAVFVGQLTVSGVKPRGGLSGSSVNLQAGVTAELTVRLVSTQSGGTMWRSSAAANRTVGRVAISDRLPSVAVRDPNEAYDAMVRDLVIDVTRDLRPTRVRQ